MNQQRTAFPAASLLDGRSSLGGRLTTRLNSKYICDLPIHSRPLPTPSPPPLSSPPPPFFPVLPRPVYPRLFLLFGHTGRRAGYTSRAESRLRPDFTSQLVHELAFGTPKFYIALYDKINHGVVNLSSNCDVKSGLRPDFTSKLVHVLAFGTPKFYIGPYDKIKHELVNLSSNCDMKSSLSR